VECRLDLYQVRDCNMNNAYPAGRCGKLRRVPSNQDGAMTSIFLRRWHSYIGLFIAPSVLFFAITGAIQIFNLHEAHGSYRPAILLEKLSAVHKDQVFEEPRDHQPPDEQPAAASDHGGGAQPADDDDDKVSAATLALKWFFFVVSVGLTLSTSIGIWIGVTQIRAKRGAWTSLSAGVLIPVILLLL
jgi:hypothetical protein